MKLEEYIIAKNEIINKFSSKSKEWHEDFMIAKFNIVSACLSNYLPHIHHSEHERIFKNILLHQELSIFEQSFYDLPDYVGYENLNSEVRTVLQKGGAIVCTFHTGSYRLINHFLAKNDMSYALVLSREAIRTQGEVFTKIFADLNEGRSEKLDLKIIDAESPTSAIQMIRELKKGNNLVIYIDGNSGAGAETLDNQNNCKVNFLQQQIFARQGVGYLAHSLQVPIVTVASYRKTLSDIRLRFFNPIYPDSRMDKTVAAEKTTGQIYDLLAPIIKEYPEQWEAWLYLHKVACISKPETGRLQYIKPFPAPGDKVIFNAASFGIFKIVKDSFLFKKSNYKSYKITQNVYAELLKCTNAPIQRQKIDIPEFDELYENNVLIYA